MQDVELSELGLEMERGGGEGVIGCELAAGLG